MPNYGQFPMYSPEAAKIIEEEGKKMIRTISDTLPVDDVGYLKPRIYPKELRDKIVKELEDDEE